MKKARLLVTTLFAALAFSAAACTSPTAPDNTDQDGDHVIGSGNHVIGSGNHVIGSGNHIIGSGN
jgi:hypothetical protein